MTRSKALAEEEETCDTFVSPEEKPHFAESSSLKKQVFKSSSPPAAMTKRKSKKPQEEDTSILLEPSVSQAKSKTSSHTTSKTPVLLFIVVFTVGASMMGWFCAQQQESLDKLSVTFTTMQRKIANLQQVADAQTGFSVEERIFALEEAQKQARKKADVALTTSEKLKNSDNYAQLWALHDETDTRLTEIKQVALSVTTLQAMFNNQSVEFEAVKESVKAGLSSSSALAENVAGLTNVMLSACSRVDDQVASVEALHAQLEGQASDLNELKESMDLHQDALHTNNQEMAAIKELVEAKQVMRAQALEEMLSSVQMTLDEQYFTSQTLRGSLMTQLQTFHSRLANPSRPMKAKSNEESPAAEEFVSTTGQNAVEVMEEKLEDMDEQDDDEAEEEAEEEEAMQEEQPLEQEVEGSIVEEQGEEEEITEEEEDITPKEEEDITPEQEEDITPEEEEEDKDNTEQSKVVAEEDVGEETVDSLVLDESLEEEVSEEVEKTVVEDSGELNREVFMDGNYEDV
ncbi:ring-infected erythrocyte surface antigen-like [Clinocottus analis]|uniref:ring-infected erythrocyte surface antigen-like n=1 Tax=Clinocottus analis TaxID=304258 RepID=UPI0035BECF94